MNVSVTREGNDAALKIAVTAAEVDKSFKQAVARIANQVRIPGFRPGSISFWSSSSVPGITCASIPRHFSSSIKFFIPYLYIYSLFHLLTYSPFLRHGIISAATPGVTSQDAPDGQSEALDRTMFHNGLLGILATCGSKSARGP